MKNLVALACASSIALVSSFSFADDAPIPACPSVSAVKSVNLTPPFDKLNGGYTSASDDAYNLETEYPWVVFLTGLESNRMRAAYNSLEKIDTRVTEKAQQEYLMSIPVLACTYTSSTHPNLKLVALPILDTLNIFTSGHSSKMNLKALSAVFK